MPTTLGQHLLIDFYGCYADSISDPVYISDALQLALQSTNQTVTDITCQEYDNEIIVVSTSSSFHICLHAYPEMGYVAIDIYSFQHPVKSTLLMKYLKDSFGAERVKATSVNRGDFTVTDMKPRSRTTLTAKGRVKSTGKKIKKTGSSIKNTGVKVFRVISRRKQK